MKYLLAVMGLVMAINVNAQDTVWISKKGVIIPLKDSAQSFNVIYKNKADTQQVKLVRHFMDGGVQEEINFFPYTPIMVLQGVFRRYSDGKLVDERIYNRDQLHGSHKTFWENGQLRRNDLYENGKFIGGRCYGFNGDDTAWFAYEKQASFPGGNDSLKKFIAKNFYYPNDARDERIEGTVNIKFTIAKDGSLENIQLINSVHDLLDTEAMRLVKLMPKWTPAIEDGRLVKMLFILPVVFRLNNDE